MKIANVMSNKSMSLEEAINLVGEVLSEEVQDCGNVIINGKYYYYENLELTRTQNGYEIIEK